VNKVLLVSVITLPVVIFLSIFGNNILVGFRENENDLIEAENDVKRTLVGGDGWTDPGDWTTSE